MPRKVQVVQLKTQQHQRTDSSDEFYEASRQEQRYIRIRDRVPTGHPGLVQRVNEVHRELAEMEGNISDTASSVSAEVTTKHSKKSSSKKDPSASSSSKKKEKHSSDSKQRDREREKKKKEKPPAPPVESSDEESVEPEVLVKTVKVPSKKKKSKPEKARVGIEKATVIGKDDDDEWNDKKRSQVRSTRINNRRPTGHPQLAKKLAPQLRKLEMNSDEDSDENSAQAPPAAASRHHVPSSEEDTETSPPKRRSGDKEKREKSSKRDKERSSREKDRDRRGDDESSSKKKKSKDAIKFGDARPIDEDSDGSWEEEERKETRFNRIRTRVPTGHPGLAKRLLESKMLNDLEDDDDDEEESEEEVVVKVKSSSKSSRHKSSSKSSSKTRV